MIKVLCIKSDSSYYRSSDAYEDIPYVIKNNYYYFDEDHKDNYLIAQVYEFISETNRYGYLGTFLKSCFISLTELREQVINKILEND